MYSINTNIKFLIPICYITTLLALTPPYNFNQKVLKRKNIWKCYAILFFICTSFLYTRQGVYTVYLEKYTTKCETIIRLASSILMHSANVIIMIRTIFSKIDKWKELLSELQRIDESLSWRISKIKQRRISIYADYISNHLMFLIVIIIDIFAYLKFNQPIWYLPLIYLPAYQLHMSAMLMKYFGSIIFYRYKTLNGLLSDTMNINTSNKIFSLEITNTKYRDMRALNRKKQFTIENIMKLYMKLLNVVGLFNDVFGWDIILLKIVATAGILPTFALIAANSMKRNFDTIIGPDIYVWLFLTSAVWSTWKLVLCVMVIKSCNSAGKEGQKCAPLSYKMLKNIMGVHDHQRLRHDIRLFAQFAASYPPKFSAADVFPVDYTLLYIIFTAITSYLIVVIQFLQSS